MQSANIWGIFYLVCDLYTYVNCNSHSNLDNTGDYDGVDFTFPTAPQSTRIESEYLSFL